MDMLANTAIEDSYLEAMCFDGTDLVMTVELAIFPGHPHYNRPKEHEYHCLVRSRIMFRHVSNIQIASLCIKADFDPVDNHTFLGGLDLIERIDFGWLVEGDFGSMTVLCDALEIMYDTAHPA